jgi:hypothetical protein
LILSADMRFELVADGGRGLMGFHDPDGFEVMPPNAEGLDRPDKFVVRPALGGMNVVADKDGSHPVTRLRHRLPFGRAHKALAFLRIARALFASAIPGIR